MLKKILEYAEKHSYYLFMIIFIVYFSLSLLRYPAQDELYYLLETSNMANILAGGEWIGNYHVGLHGFLFKLPVAFLFMIFGPSVFLATLFTVCLSVLSCFLFFKILKKYFDEFYSQVSGLVIFATSYYFVLSTVTFLREIPVLFSFLLFLYLLIYNKNKFLIGLSIMLILDAKEHVFFQLMPGFFLYLIYSHFIKEKGRGFISNFKKFAVNCFMYFTPTLVFLFLMFFTGIVPVNMYTAQLLGFLKGGFFPLLSHSAAGHAAPGMSQNFFSRTIFSELLPGLNSIYDSKFIKFFTPRTFSFLSIPKLVIIPAIYAMIKSVFKRDDKIGEDAVMLSYLFWSFFLIFYFRPSHGRYLLSISPVIIMFFLKFLQGLKNNKENKIVIIITCAAICIGFLFEIKFLFIKVILNIVLISLVILFMKNNEIEKIDKGLAYLSFGLVLAFFTSSTALTASYTLEDAQIKNFLTYGYAGEIYKLSDTSNDDEKIWINDDYRRLGFYRKERITKPRRDWEIAPWVPKKKMLVRSMDKRIFTFGFDDLKDFKKKLFENGIGKVYYLTSSENERVTGGSNDSASLKSCGFLKFIEEFDLKNRKGLIFEVVR